MSEKEEMVNNLGSILEKLAEDILSSIGKSDVGHTSVRVSKTSTDGLTVHIAFGNLIREEYVWESGEFTPLEKQISNFAKENGFDYGVLNSGGSGDKYTDWTSMVLGTLVG